MSELLPHEQERLAECRKATVDFVNGILREFGDPAVVADMFPGKPKDTHSCSIARTIRVATGGDLAASTRTHETSAWPTRGPKSWDHHTREHPDEVAEFSAYFDAGLYEDLVMEP